MTKHDRWLKELLPKIQVVIFTATIPWILKQFAIFSTKDVILCLVKRTV